MSDDDSETTTSRPAPVGHTHARSKAAANDKVTLPPASGEGETAYRLHRRFDRMGRLVGDEGMTRLFKAHVMVIGLGGVGSFAVEALARSGIGRITMVDFDRVCVTNSNRQLQALAPNIARQKAAVLAERVKLINPQCDPRPIPTFYEERTSEKLLGERPDFIVDAIDNIKAKCHLIAACRDRAIPIVVSTGASARMDPTAIRVVDLALTKVDPLADAVRRILRQKYQFPKRGDFGVSAVYSTEEPQKPHELHYDGGEGFRCVCPSGKNDHHSCEERPIIWGTAGFVTGAFGLACASVAVKALLA